MSLDFFTIPTFVPGDAPTFQSEVELMARIATIVAGRVISDPKGHEPFRTS